MKKKVIFASIATLSLAVTIAATMVIGNGRGYLISRATEHSETSNCYWNHYAAEAATESSVGCKEYWVCCDHHHVQLEEPTVGQNLDADPLPVPSSVLTYLDENPDDIRFVEKTFSDHIPTTDQLSVSGGYRFEIGSPTTNCGFNSQSSIERVDLVSNSTAKAALKGNNDVGKYVVHISSSDGSGNVMFNGLGGSSGDVSANNVPDSKDVTIQIKYYYVTDTPHFLYNGSGTGNRERNGNFVTWSLSIVPTSGFKYISVYPAGTLVDLYIYDIIVTMTDHEVQQTTPNGYAVGDIITLYSAGGSFAGGTSKPPIAISDYANDIDSELAEHSNLGSAPKLVTITSTGSDGNMEINQGNESRIESGVKYRFTVTVYNFSWNGTLFLNFQNNAFIQMSAGGIGVGYQELSVDFTMSNNYNWLLLYTNSKTLSGSFYIGNITAEVLEIL